MKKFVKNPWVLAIGSTVIGGVLLSFVLDWIKGVDWLQQMVGTPSYRSARYKSPLVLTFTGEI